MKSFIAVVAAIATALLLSSCTSPTETPATTGPTVQNNAADVAFVTGMIPHHQQAVAMSALVPQRSTNAAVVKLAADISAAQGPEIETMKAFMAQWGANSQEAGHDGHGGGMEMQGMVDDATMSRLASLRGAEFDQLWLNSMIGHHEGAIAMAKTELADGANPDAKTLAQQIVTVQQSEITQMQKMGVSTDGG